MEFVRHHVKASSSTSFKGFFGSENVDYDPPSNSLRQNIKKAKCRYVYGLADGATGDDEEAAIRDAMQNSENSYELIRMVFAVGGWSGMDDELEEAYLDPIAARIAQVLDQRDYVPWILIRRYLYILDYNSCPTLGDALIKVLGWKKDFHANEFDEILNQKANILRTVASATMRKRYPMVQSALIAPHVIQAFDAAAPHREDDLVRMMHEVNYTTRVCTSMAQLMYRDLYDTLLDMANPALDPRQRVACYEVVKGLHLEFAAVEGAVKYAGTTEAKSTVDRFMRTRKAALDTFTPIVPPANILTAIAQAIGSVATTIADLITSINALPDILTTALTLPKFTGEEADDDARSMINNGSTQGWLSRVPREIKQAAINACLDGGTDDDDEGAINKVLLAAKSYDQAELYELASASTWESLYTCFDGDEYDQLEDILSQPT